MMIDQVRAGKWAWVAGGRNRTSTTHVDNVVEGLLCGALRGAPGNAYFVLDDGGPVVFRDFVSELMRTQGVEPPSRSVPKVLARFILPTFAYWITTQDCILDDTKARTQLGYAPVTDRETGLNQLRGSARGMTPSLAT
jgi:nucleoside-diphosphate-sugar epimerase